MLLLLELEKWDRHIIGILVLSAKRALSMGEPRVVDDFDVQPSSKFISTYLIPLFPFVNCDAA